LTATGTAAAGVLLLVVGVLRLLSGRLFADDVDPARAPDAGDVMLVGGALQPVATAPPDI
jgi:hypothetical protein